MAFTKTNEPYNQSAPKFGLKLGFTWYLQNQNSNALDFGTIQSLWKFTLENDVLRFKNTNMERGLDKN